MHINETFKNLIPRLQESEYNALEESIIKEGCRDSIVLWNNIIIDGHNRFEICTKHAIFYNTVNREFENEEDVKQWMIINQFGRRNLSAFQRANLALQLKDSIAIKAKENCVIAGGDKGLHNCANPPIETRKELASMAKVSHETIRRTEAINEKATPEQIEKLETGEASINSVFTEIKKVEKKEKRIEEIEQQKEDIKSGKIDITTGPFNVVVVDPPWNYGRKYDPNGSRVANPYPEMTNEEIIDKKPDFADDSILWLWTTHKFIFDAHKILEEWGFTFKSVLIWDKESMGMGSWLRMQCEFCLLGVKGDAKINSDSVRDIIREKRREHSRKPEAFFNMVGDVCLGKKIDFYSREKRDGWSQGGNDVDKF